MFSIEIQPFGPKRKIIVSSSEGYGVEILPDHGAALNALFVPDVQHTHFINVIGGYDDSEEAEKVGDSFKGVLLFPFGNRVEDGKWRWKGVDYQFDINEIARNHALHGLVYNRSFEVVETSATSEQAFIYLRHKSEGNDSGFPFLYQVDVEYLLQKSLGLTINTSVSNLGSASFPFGIGWHPYFKTGNPIDSLKIKLPKGLMAEVNERMIPTGKKSSYNRFEKENLIGDTFLDSGFEISQDAIGEVIMVDSAQNLRLVVGLKSDVEAFRFLQVYTPPHRQSIAIEPMTHGVNSLANPQHEMIVLGPGERRSFGFFIGY